MKLLTRSVKLTVALSSLLGLSTLSIAETGHASGTINLALDQTRYCATAVHGNFYTGVTPGACGVIPPTSCPDGRVTRMDVSYVPSTGTRYGVDVTKYENIFGFSNAQQTIPATFPGARAAAPVMRALPRTGGYVALQFTVPTTLPVGSYGWIGRTTYNYGSDVTIVYSPNCGEFNTDNAACKSLGASAGNGPRWTVGASTNKCPLVPGATYYMNIKQTNPAQATAYCSVGMNSCVQGMTDNF